MSFKVALKNVGRNMVNKDFTVSSGNIEVAVAEAFLKCQSILGEGREFIFSQVYELYLRKVVSKEIRIMIGNVCAGSLTITKQC